MSEKVNQKEVCGQKRLSGKTNADRRMACRYVGNILQEQDRKILLFPEKLLTKCADYGIISHVAEKQSGCGAVWQRATLGWQRPWVQIPPLRPKLPNVNTFGSFLFIAYPVLIAPQNNSFADIVALLTDSFQFQNHLN